ncbi:uncharacterized protein L3040_007363 [Drepanopeziza brunnea f. sp. 'multigermtubi']|uniref:uncharacterized protein n=1 Tax=Drepanopeziza brunnea f. sp. 'multigermtubi' TaxID=698441 RepID=UPI0023928A71|nr:hypothetical protein L3040_007363 [Drepanopeziza brunnea f. sp. 'multigermtubi']
MTSSHKSNNVAVHKINTRGIAMATLRWPHHFHIRKPTGHFKVAQIVELANFQSERQEQIEVEYGGGTSGTLNL